jgi:hypothetical protein
MGITGYSISLAISVNKLTSDNTQTVFVMIRCGEFVSACTIRGLFECSNLLVHCRKFCQNGIEKNEFFRLWQMIIATEAQKQGKLFLLSTLKKQTDKVISELSYGVKMVPQKFEAGIKKLEEKIL